MKALTKDQIKELIARQLSGVLTPEEDEQLKKWLASDPENQKWYEQFNGEYASELLHVAGRIRAEQSKSRILAKTKRAPVYVMFTRAIVAASVIGIIGWAAYQFLYNPEKENLTQRQPMGSSAPITPGTYKATLSLAGGKVFSLDSASHEIIAAAAGEDIIKAGSLLQYADDEMMPPSEALFDVLSTPVGGMFELILADGTHVWLNAKSSIRYPRAFNGSERKVEVTGEVYFEVAKNASKPFIVQARNMEVQVLGTHFNIMAYEEEPTIQTTLVEGKVAVSSGNETLTLSPNNQARLTSSGKFSLIPNADVQTALSWRFNTFRFNSTPVEQIMRQIARWYDVNIVFKDASARNIEFNGGISRFARVEDVLERMESTNEIHFSVEGRTIRVSR